jgi:uncharacterized protein (DUF3084 family)
MAQIEIIMYLALGFATAGLIALLLGRLLWDLAVSVGRRRAQRTAPPAVAELQAERNQLRAENAMLARRLEVRLNELKMQLAEHMAEVSRSRNRVDHLSTEIEKRDASLAERDAEIGRLTERCGILESELAARTEILHWSQDEPGELDGTRATDSQVPEGRQAIASGPPATGHDGLEPGRGRATADDAVNGSAAERRALTKTKPAQGGKKTTSGFANVVSFAQRLRAPQRNG